MTNEIISIEKAAVIVMQDEVNCKVTGVFPPDMEILHDKFAILTKDFLYMPLYKLGVWDGKKEFFFKTGKTFIFLLPQIITLLKQMDYKVSFRDNRISEVYDPDIVIDETYFSHITNPKTKNPYVLAEHQIEAANVAFTEGSGILLAGTGFGKAQPLTSKVLTPSGWTLMGDIKVGDSVITPKNTTSFVIGIYPQGDKDVYELVCNDGATARSCNEHLWMVHNDMSLAKSKKPFVIYNTEELANRANTLSDAYKPRIPLIPTPISFASSGFEVHPYLLGIVIPYIHSASLEGVFLNKVPKTIRDRIGANLEKYEIELIKRPSKCWEIISSNVVVMNMIQQIQYLKLNYFDIKVPDNYIYCSVDSRTQFFKGLCDSYAKITNTGVISLSNIKESLVEQLQEMVWLHGGACKISKRGDNSAVVIYHHEPSLFFSIGERISNYIEYHGSANANVSLKSRRVDSVNLVSNEPTQCIMIDDPNHLYITDNCLITHNTILNGCMIDVYGKQGCKTITIVPSKSLVLQTLAQFKILRLDAGQYDGEVKDINHQHIVSTWQTLQNNPHLIKLFQVVIIDECVGENTKITMGDKTLKAIKDVNPNDMVLSYNELTKQYEVDKVIKVHNNISINEKMYKLAFNNGIIMEVTGNHKILTTNGYIRADEITSDHDIICRNKHNIAYRYNQLLQRGNQQLYIVNWGPSKVDLSNGCVVCGEVRVRQMRHQVKSERLVKYFDMLYNEFDEVIRDLLYSKIKNEHNSLQQSAFYTNASDDAKQVRIEHMRRINEQGRAISLLNPPWSKGKTKHTDNRIARYAQKFSEERKGENNPSFGRPKSPETIKKQSDNIKAKIANNEWTPHVHNSRTHWDCSYNGKSYRSSWEVIYAYLNPMDLYETIRIRYEYGNTYSTYIVDFVNHNDKILTEVKPKAHIKDAKFEMKKLAALDWCENNGYDFRIVSENYFKENIHLVDMDKLNIPNKETKLRQFS